MDKRLVLLPLMVLTITLVVGCVPKKEGDKKLSAATKAVTQVSTQEMKTYVSRYGFSVSYPKDWCLMEDKNIKPSDYELEGYVNFSIVNFDPDNPGKNQSDQTIGIEFLFNRDVSAGLRRAGVAMPDDTFEKIIFLAEKNNIYKKNDIDSIENIDINGIQICLIYFEGKHPWQALFYLPKKDSIVSIAGISGEYSSGLMFLLNTLILVNEK
ncbi:hypothetical protein A3K48_03405 [candidate division WOR-1 bacterium RIFOXYA12_FULL_52_29]|uniref:PsbP C-terminal domain-containing protein n=1 Tax=candidate division WOR-1 bacterium RIFOXYC12_FULL_54_18 TaxID=1802584 RepID=A0A1F4T693_UNCSA|nr:MAG: hypothetical protein A3K44_03405 [candidate division WOR-1 bacterium RIFOXYA2_FULL_51_19]OGC17612.1 MAG: hypothetical protein A3K48_03405 [candidate division WOR-1 bacterium RIFOXYA12_FULL_52_29]OGC26469.1 MAG: hypothetical protein A3K32_03400 [candidate division WOR-1 bacterium RIFOXYB2_FULL_45_9]OGC28029.1 MAG: hypothetical protein A3K49_03405 [candidate division WOR-1 bacterium RIFOXYC12_FULL_54_18]OGC29685.1 MAG: hypothetical protein A2346_02930 [candidate division WOR-1 bacterium R